MPAILALEKISKRFGAIVVADGIDLALARRRGARHHRAERRRQDHAVRHRSPAPSRPTPGASSSTARDITRPAAASGAAARHRALVSDPAAVRRHDRVREPRGRRRPSAAAERERDVYGDCVELLERCGLADKANRLAGALTLLDRKRLELARALATGPRVLLLDEVAGGLTEHECARAGRADPATCARPASRSSGSSTWCMRCIAVVDRLVVLHGGGFIAEGDRRR